MSTSWHEGVGVLRAHYGMVGPAPDVIPHPKEFARAFIGAAATTELSIFQSLPPLLLINSWDSSEFIIAPKEVHGRLRFLGAVASFLIDFDRFGMPWPVRTHWHLLELVTCLQNSHMAGDVFDEYLVYATGPTSEFFNRYGLSVEWKLADFWKSWSETLQRNYAAIAQMVRCDPIYTEKTNRYMGYGDPDDPARLPFGLRVLRMEAIILDEPYEPFALTQLPATDLDI